MNEAKGNQVTAFEEWFMLLSKVPYMSHETLARRAFDAGQLVEREACAMACEAIGKDIVCPEECAAVIRERSNVKVSG